MALHALFDGIAWLAAALVTLLLRRTMADAFPPGQRLGHGYLAAILVGGAAGAYLLGTLNLWLAGMAGLSRSIEGALAGAIAGVELYKFAKGIRGRTAAIYALPVAIGIAVGRIGCFLAGLEDFTYGIPTGLPWGHDFGDGIPRHPVQLYEAGALVIFALVYLIFLLRRDRFTTTNGFSLLVLFYAVQRFGLEFLKPYPKVLAGLTLFQIVCVMLAVYALAILRQERSVDAART